MLLATLLSLSLAPQIAGDDLAPRPRLRARDPFPNIELVRHDGQKVRFQDDLMEDRIFVLNFMYTTCADVCPMETARLSELQAILGDRVGEEIHMYSITVDPDRDTPEVLADYRERFGVEAGWDFFTGDEQEILTLRRRFGLYFDDTEDLQDHNINMVIGNARTGQFLRRSPFDNPYVLATQVTSWVSDFRDGGVGTADFEGAPARLPQLHEGELLFRTRCAVCHRIGEGDGRDRIGPNLKGVTSRREADWTLRWILEPDKVLEEGDPIVEGLLVAYNGVRMPNLGLSEEEARQILDFLEVEDRRVTRVEGNEELRERQGEEAPECCQKAETGVIDRDGEVDGSGAGEVEPDRGAPVSLDLSGLRVEYLLGGVLMALGLAVRRFRS
jgi:protein SCO1/2